MIANLDPYAIDRAARLHRSAAGNFNTFLYVKILMYLIHNKSSGSVVECLTSDREAASSSLTDVTALWSLSMTHLS